MLAEQFITCSLLAVMAVLVAVLVVLVLAVLLRVECVEMLLVVVTELTSRGREMVAAARSSNPCHSGSKPPCATRLLPDPPPSPARACSASLTLPCAVLLSLCHRALHGATQPVSLCPPQCYSRRLPWLLPQSSQRPHLVVSRRAALKPKTS